MRALTLTGRGGVEHVQYRDDVPVPPLRAPTDVRVRLRAAALNHLDLFVARGLPGVETPAGWVMGADGAGVVELVGDAVEGVRVGDRVLINPGVSDRTCEFCRRGEQSLCVHYRILGEHLPGTFADHVVVPAANVRAVPTGISWETAAAFTLATLTAWRMMVTRAMVRAGEDVLIWGIGGGVAVAALQVAKLQGARVWVTSSSAAKLECARALGADITLDHRTQNVAAEVRSRTGKRGVDVVVDNVGQATWGHSLRALARGGRLVTCGATSGPMVETDVRRMFWNQWTLMGSTMGNDAELDVIVRALAAGALVPPVDAVYDLADGRAALERLAAGEQFGKIVLRVSED